MSDIGSNIRKLRKEKGWTLAELAGISEVAAKYIGSVENGKRKPGNTFVRKMAEAFAVDEDTLRFGDRKEEKPQTPEHLRLLFERIQEVFPTSSDLVQKSEVLSKIMRDLRDGNDR